MTYDPQNIFARILRGEVPCQKVYEDTSALAFHDLHPRAPIHILVIPKGAYTSFLDFSTLATPEEMVGFFKAVSMVAQQFALDTKGCRVLSNVGVDGGQEVPHFHIHILGGRPLGPMLSPLISAPNES